MIWLLFGAHWTQRLWFKWSTVSGHWIYYPDNRGGTANRPNQVGQGHGLSNLHCYTLSVTTTHNRWFGKSCHVHPHIIIRVPLLYQGDSYATSCSKDQVIWCYSIFTTSECWTIMPMGRKKGHFKTGVPKKTYVRVLIHAQFTLYIVWYTPWAMLPQNVYLRVEGGVSTSVRYSGEVGCHHKKRGECRFKPLIIAVIQKAYLWDVEICIPTFSPFY